MTEITAEQVAKRYSKLSSEFIDLVSQVKPESWDNQSPCDEWTARGVVRHVAETTAQFRAFIGRTFEPKLSADTDPMGAIKEATEAIQADLNDPQIANAGFDGYRGPTTFAKSIDDFVCFDLIIHSWDLAKAANLDVSMDPQEVERLWNFIDGENNQLSASGAFKPQIKVGENAPLQARLLGALGRNPN